MKSNVAIWFVGGLVCGLGSLLVALAISAGPSQAPASPPPQSIDDTRVGAAALELIRRANAELDRSASRAQQAPGGIQTHSIDDTRVGKALLRFIEAWTAEAESGGTDAGGASLLSDLQTVRSQIELYRVQHNDRAPGVDTKGRFAAALFVSQMTRPTKINGEVWSGQGRRADYAFGPYLQRMPANPFVKGPAASRVSGGKGPPPGDGSTGWYFNTGTGKFFANDPGNKDK